MVNLATVTTELDSEEMVLLVRQMRTSVDLRALGRVNWMRLDGMVNLVKLSLYSDFRLLICTG